MEFEQFFKQATGNDPYDYQSRLARANPWPDVLEAPTGVGKTEAVVLAWLWRRRYHLPESTPRRLVYCLPMRVLVEQTYERVKQCLVNLKFSDQVGIHLLMGGEDDNDWDMYPERDAILIGTQDMLLSRALNRGYALSRYRWPVQFGLLNNDCLWVYDEVQLMGSGLATTAQLAAFREQFGVWGHCPSLWVSATLRREWLATVDFKAQTSNLIIHQLEETEWTKGDLSKRLNAKKILQKAQHTAEDPDNLANEIKKAHQPDKLTLVMLNTVSKATAVYKSLKGLYSQELNAPELLLLHSRFRPPERRAKMQRLRQMQENGGIVVATQVIEAGVDISARVLFTELSPWASFVQRVGRCNRKGEFETAEVFWIDVDTTKKSKAKPYEAAELNAARAELIIKKKAQYTADEPEDLAKEIYAAHQKNGALTLVILNTKEKAIAIYDALATHAKKGDAESKLLLLHSDFSPSERWAKMQRLRQMQETGGIVVAAQVIEAGVDISAHVLFTELSPWALFIQRIGCCNCKGKEVFWIDVDTKKMSKAEADELNAARAELESNTVVKDVGPCALRDYLAALPDSRRQALYPPYEAAHVIRRRTAQELFDTTPDLTDADIDISLYIREDDEHDIQVFWRAWSGDDPNQPKPQPAPARDELCPATLNKETKDWLKKQSCWRWSFLEGRWQRADNIVPGQIYLLPTDAGGYSPEKGFDPGAKEEVDALDTSGQAPEGNDDDPYSSERKIWQTIAAHTNQVVEEMERILQALGALLGKNEANELRHAARWHDWGKASEVFQKALTAKATPDFPLPDELHRWGKSGGRSERYARPGFRHELASALGMLALGHSDLSCYLAAAHHGKVRLSIRSLPNEKPAPNGRRFARGVWEGDSLPEVKLGGGVIVPAVTLSLAPMELGLSADGQPSWAERVLNLLEHYGSYRLAYLEALLCAADRRASANPRPEVSND
jgi:CRISPR-associated helicase Cas3